MKIGGHGNMKKNIFTKRAKTHTKVDKNVLLQLEESSSSNLMKKLELFTIGDSTVVGDIATNKAQGEVDVIGKPKKKKKKNVDDEEEVEKND
jgi:hypothetical protein